MAYSYRYMTKDKPLTHCPDCKTSLTRENGINIVCTDERHSPTFFEVRSRLENGWLLDPSGDVANGKHSLTECAFCATPLIENDDVEEIQIS